MKNLKIFTDFVNEEEEFKNIINIVLDVSGSIRPNLLQSAINENDFGNYDSIIFIQVDYKVEQVDNLNDIQEMKITSGGGGGGADLQSALDYITFNDLQHHKTFIISDFYCEDVDWSVLDYELIKID